ncbi:MAG: NAD+ synthase [Proteobacteria bacterium]|nr:NAD+ synthase [Pseudomonadota bacterium]MBU4296834.1 NAD+ synthase [Pseudomonadota bacterium]MCG2748985.1 NAD+ synthase [Desulfobulbaceae bacterium]
MKIALTQINPVIGNFTDNIAHIASQIQTARNAGCQLAIFPELAISGYPPQDYLEHEAFLTQQQVAILRLVAETQGIGVLCGAITRHSGSTGKPLHNSALLFEGGNLLFSAHKRLLPTYDVFDETRYFEPGQTSIPFIYQGLRLGITICEDIFNDEDSFPHPLYQANPVADLKQGGIDLLINIAASPFTMGKQQLRRTIFSQLCRKYHIPLVYVNQVGGQDSILFDGASMVLGNDGALCHQAKSFCEDMLIIDTEQLHAAPTPGEMDETGLVFQALAMGCRDYIRKCGFSKVLLGLSGGIDSALTCAIACEALGAENVTGVALPSPYTSQESIDDARALAANLGIRFEIIAISDTFASFRQTLSPLFAGLKEDVTEQNIQARIRGTLLMALANKFNALLLSTGNKSEMAVGYCTLYGDMAGALSLLSDVPKQMVYALARFVNRQQEIIPSRTIIRAPTAELAPDQKDQDDLPPYEMLDPILSAYLEEHLSIAEIVSRGFDKEIVKDIIRRIKRNEYKRQQAAMGLKVTSKAFGFGRRYPIAQLFRE